MPADALPVPHSAAATVAASTFTLTFGAYSEPTFVGMAAILRRSSAYIDPATGVVSRVSWTVTVAPDGTASVSGLPYNDDGTTYSVEWQALSWKPTPGNKTFSVLAASGLTTVRYDTLQSSTSVSIPAPADAAVAALLRDRTSLTYGAAATVPNYPNEV